MNAQDETASRHGVFSLLMSMLSTRLELAAIDIEDHAQATLVALATAFVAVVLGLIAFVFVGIAVITYFWDTHRIAAATGVTLGYVMLAAFVALQSRARWRARPAAFAGTLRELELDAQAFRGRS
jgi:uncharacterized membrane protein YqjE